MRVSIRTYGCTLNQSDGELMRDILEGSGAATVAEGSGPDVLVVNTCTVKKVTEQKILYRLSTLERMGARMVVTGCMASANPDLIQKYAPSASILTTSNVQRIAEAVRAASEGRRVVFDGHAGIDKPAMLGHAGGVIARVPVSEGCLSSCSFCETKFARGPLNSFPESSILNAIRYSVAHGAKEIQLTSQDTGAYGADRRTDIAELMGRIASIDGDFRVRVGMLNPEHLHKYLERFISILGHERFYKFVHLPLQSGSDAVLESMGRNYTAEEFIGYARRISDAVPGLTLATDVIVGYPGETDRDFKATMDLISEVKPAITNISKFSARPHARASRLRQLPSSVVNRRSIAVYRLTRSIQNGVNSERIGMVESVLLTEHGDDSINGRDDSYRSVVVKNPVASVQLGSRVAVRIHSASASSIYGTIEGPESVLAARSSVRSA